MIKIAGKRTVSDWESLSGSLVGEFSESNWGEALHFLKIELMNVISILLRI